MPWPAHTEEHLGCRTDVQVSVGVPTCVSDHQRSANNEHFFVEKPLNCSTGSRSRAKEVNLTKSSVDSVIWLARLESHR